MKTFLFCLSFLFISLSSNVCNRNTEISRISVKENTFVDERGGTMIFKGLNASDPDRLEKEEMWTQRYFDEVKSWGTNLVRFPIHPSAWRERGKKEYLALIDRGVAMAQKADLYVVLDWHSIGNLKTEKYQHERYYTTKKETFDFWKTMAKRYGNNPTVAFYELFNEPTTIRGELGEIEWLEWKAMMEDLIDVVRDNGGKGIPLVAGFDWAYDLTEIRSNPIDREGIAYVSHPYPMKRSKPWEEQWQKDWGFVSLRYPVILTEIGFCEEGERGAHVPVIDDGSYVKEILDYTDRRGISYIIWVFDKDWSPQLIEDWDFTLSKAGKVWKDLMSEQY